MRKTIVHRDNTVSYWDVYSQTYRERVDPRGITWHDHSALPRSDRSRILNACVRLRKDDCA